MAKKAKALKHRNRFVRPMLARHSGGKMRDRRARRAKDARKSWRREEWS